MKFFAIRRPFPIGRLLGIALALSLPIHAGCGGGTFIAFDRPVAPIDFSAIVQVGIVEDCVPDTRFDKRPPAAATQALRGALADLLVKEGVFDRVNVNSIESDEPDYEVNGKILSYKAAKDPGALVRLFSFVLFGFGGGGEDGRLLVNLRLQDLETGRIVYSGNFMARSKDPISGVARDFAKDLKATTVPLR